MQKQSGLQTGFQTVLSERVLIKMTFPFQTYQESCCLPDAR